MSSSEHLQKQLSMAISFRYQVLGLSWALNLRQLPTLDKPLGSRFHPFQLTRSP